MPGAKLSRYTGELRGQILDALLGQIGVQDLQKALSRNQPAAPELEIEKPGHAESVQLSSPELKIIESSRQIDTADQRADGRAANDCRLDAGAFEASKHPDVSPTARDAATKRHGHSAIRFVHTDALYGTATHRAMIPRPASEAHDLLARST